MTTLVDSRASEPGKDAHPGPESSRRPADPLVPPRPDFQLPLWVALITAIGGGVLLDAGFPGTGEWPLTFVGVGLLLLSAMGRRGGGAFLVGSVGGVTFYLILVSWTSFYLGAAPWLAMSIFEGLVFGLGMSAITLAYRWIPRVWTGVVGRLVVLPAVVAGLWTGREYVAGHYPFGGFSWGRVAESQSESPLAPLAAWLGISGLSFLIVAVIAVLIQLARERTLRLPLRCYIAAIVIVAVFAVPAWPFHSAGTKTIASVQGNGKAGFFQKRDYGDLTAAQLSATVNGVPRTDRVDMIVWPEGASDIDPTRDPSGKLVFDTITKAYDAPLVSGVITEKGSKDYNSSLVWRNGKGVVARYDKRHLVPFGEYVPYRSFFRFFAPSLIDLLARDLTPGTDSNVLDVGGIQSGIAICFDIVDDGLVTHMVDNGAQIILAQTNNADFGTTDENQQQLAIARLRAIEASRPLVNISTVGSSAVISGTGATIDSIPAYTPDAMVTKVQLGTGTTPAIAMGAALEAFVSLFGIAVLVLARVLLRGTGYGASARARRGLRRSSRAARRA